ncbi:hypothetical protein FZC76_14600 [Sutcliffiella horikoshii]|uniref:Uncharacterized protein n=1 Tax=Sutcliffiella horikoshii TaxID=79883 RepID=A0A5D4SZN1_9BACI|nr:hypothetical protein [Sutcliffiella horikoshii]TYS67788.1 hypothetical protein FZC76_14600 [Sutcliffiella horikoshii]
MSSFFSHQVNCVNAFKIYDWVQKRFEGEVDVFRSDGEDGLISGIDLCSILSDNNTLKLEAMIVDANGTPVSPDVGIKVTELTNTNTRIEKQMMLNEDCSTLNQIVIQKHGMYALKLVDASTNQVCISNPIPFTIIETLYLYAPTGTSIQCEITDVDFSVSPSCNNFQQEIKVDITICQDITSGCSKPVEIKGYSIQPRAEEKNTFACQHDPHDNSCIFPSSKRR